MSAPVSPAPLQLHHVVDDARVSVLPNGAVLLTDRLPGAASVALGVWTDAGSADEHTPRDFGVAHFLEHMLFKGTTSRSAFDITRAIEDVGGHLDAATSRYNTHLYARVPSPHLPGAIALLGDVISHPAFPLDELRRERGVVREELLKYEDISEERIDDLFHAALWPASSLAHPIVGTRSSLRALGRARVLAGWRRHFAAPRVLVSLAGDVDHDAAVSLAAAAFSDLPATPSPIPDPAPPDSPLPLAVETTDDEQVQFVWGVRAFPRTDPRHYPLAFLDLILGGMATSRLFQEVRERYGLAYDISTSVSAFRDGGIFAVTGGCAPRSLPPLLRVVHDELVRLRTSGPTREEVSRAREQLLAGIAFSSESVSERMSSLAVSYQTFGRVVPFAEVADAYLRTTSEDIALVAGELLHPARWTLAAIGPLRRRDVLRALASLS